MKTEIALNGLMKCEHCGFIFNGSFAAPAYPDDSWKCPFCMKGLTKNSFGWKIIRRKQKHFKKYFRWVGIDGNWTNTRPQKDFILEEWFVRVSPVKRKKSILQLIFKRTG